MTNSEPASAVRREPSERVVACDLVWFGFPLREALTKRTVIDFELPVSAPSAALDLDGVHRLVLETCERLLDSRRPIVVPLSGGLDSRLVLGTLLELVPREDVVCYTYGFREHLDFEIAPLVARAAGVEHVLRSYDEIAFDPAELTAFAGECEVETAPYYNLPSYYYTRKITELCLRELPPTAPLWSGFLGDRVWTGKWLTEPELSLADAARAYAAAHAHPLRQHIVGDLYDPAERLIALYQGREPLSGSSWCELFDLQQRQFFVKRSLQVAERDYVFPLAAPELVAALLSLPLSARAARRFQRNYLLRYHRSLARLPTTNAFGAPVRGTRAREQLDRVLRLARERLGRRLGITLGRFAARRYSTALVDSTWPEHRTWVREGLTQTNRALSELGLCPIQDLDTTLRDRALSQQLASVGYLLTPR